MNIKAVYLDKDELSDDSNQDILSSDKTEEMMM